VNVPAVLVAPKVADAGLLLTDSVTGSPPVAVAVTANWMLLLRVVNLLPMAVSAGGPTDGT
jgi:hypothetical protein